MGGLTALHHAVRQGNLDAALALLDGGANVNDTSLVDGTTPLLMSIINGQFDVAMRLIERGANPSIASASGMAPLYATINSQWAPRSRFPQPQSIQSQKTTHIELMQALLAKGADVNARLKKQPWYFAYNNCGNPNCGLENIDGSNALAQSAAHRRHQVLHEMPAPADAADRTDRIVGVDMRAGTETALARVVRVFGEARAHHAYLFATPLQSHQSAGA